MLEPNVLLLFHFLLCVAMASENCDVIEDPVKSCENE